MTDEAGVPLVTFTVEGQRFALDASEVNEIVRAVAIAALPKAPAIVEGVVNYRGTVVPVLDIRRRFGLPAQPVRAAHHFIVADAGTRTVVLRVDQASELIHVDPDAIEPPGRSVPGAEYVSGIARLPDGIIVIHDLERFLSLDEAAQLEHALTDTGEHAGAQQ